MASNSTPAPSIGFLDAGGEAAALIAGFSWSATPLGPIESWRQSLKTITSILLRSSVPMVMLWGVDGHMIYNDAYSVFAGERHPMLLGSKVREGWPEVAAFNDNVMRVVLAGGTLTYRDQELTLHRHGEPEQVWMDLHYSPVLDDTNAPAGVICILNETTERVLSDRRAVQEKEQMAQLFEQAPTFMALMRGPEYRFELANPGYVELAGDRPLLGRTFAEALPDAVEQGFLALLDQVFISGEPFVAEGATFWEQATPDRPARERIVDFVYQPIKDASGAVTAIFCEGVDVTKRVKADAALREGQAFTRLLLDSTSEGFYSVDRQGVTTLCNDAFVKMLGFTDSQAVIGRKLHDLIHHSYSDGSAYPVADCSIYRAASTGEPAFVDDEVFFRLDGTALPVEYRAEPILRDGELQGAICTIRDISERRSAESALAEQARTLETLNRLGMTVAADLDLERVVQTVTDAGVELTGAQFGSYFHNVMDETGERLHLFTLSGAERSDFINLGRPRATAVFGPTFRNEGVVRSDDILKDPRYGQAEPHRGMPKGHLPVRSYLAVPVVSRSGAILGGLLFGHPEPGRFSERHEQLMLGLAAQAAIAIDNARLFQAVEAANQTLEQRVAERTVELTNAHEALRQAQKMEAIGQLTGGIAHDFNNLLTGVTGSLEFIRSRLSQGRLDAVDRYLVAAEGAAKRAAALTQRLLAFSRRQTLDPKPTDLNRLIGGMEELIRRTVGPTTEIEVVGAGGLWPTMVDRSQLDNALLNLCINGRDAMPEGGRLTIETANKWLDDRAAKTHDLPPGQYVTLCVTDTGTGMTPEVIARAFDPFFTTKPMGSGTGLGLSMIYGFVRQSGGQVRIYTELGQGTTMCLYLPRHLGPIDTEEGWLPPESHGRLAADKTVLVVDDEPTVRMLVTEVLHENGFAALEAADGAAGLKILESQLPIDLLVTDVGLPGGMNGRQLADAGQALRPGLKVLFITGYAENAVLGNGHLGPGMEVVTKPFAMELLAARMRSMVGG